MQLWFQMLIYTQVALPSKSFARPSTRAVAIQPRTLYRSYATEPASTSAQNAASSHSATETAAAESETSDFKETYVAKQKSEILFKECAKQADYIVPQAFEKDGETPKNAAGEEIGQGVGWWYESRCHRFGTCGRCRILLLT